MTLLSSFLYKIFGFFASYFSKRGLDQFLRDNDDLNNKLKKVIDKTVCDYMELYPVEDIDGRYAFYKSQKVINELLKYRMMKDVYNLSNLEEAFKNEPKIMPPNSFELGNFYRLFVENINSEKKIRKIEISETFGEEVFNISKILDRSNSNIESLLSRIPNQLEFEWRRQIDLYKESINSFKPKTALGLLLKLEESFDLNEKKPTSSIIATIEYLKGQCYDFLINNDDANKSYIKAYRLETSTKIFMERACYSFYKIKDIETANKLVEDLLRIDEYNSMAWVIKILNNDSSDLDALIGNTPELVRKDFSFKRIIFFNTLSNPKYSGLPEIYKKHSIIPNISDYDGSKITINNYKEKVFWVESKLSEYLESLNLDLNGENNGDVELLKFIRIITSQFIECFSETEIKDDFTILTFYHEYAQFVLDRNREAVFRMRNIYSRLTKKNEFILFIVANCLQIIGEDRYAIEIIDSQETLNPDNLFLKAYCYFKNSDSENYVSVVQKLLPLIKTINFTTIHNILSIQYALYIFNKQFEFDNAEFIEDKNFELPCLKVLVESFQMIIKKQNDSTTITNLKAIVNEILETGSSIIFFIPYSYCILNEYSLAVDSFRKYLTIEVESRDLFYYIISLYKLKTDHKELLRILELWRKNYSFNDELLRIEADLRRQLSDWDTCLDISEYYNKNQGNDESFLTLELISLNEVKRDYKKQRLIELANIFSAFTFKQYIHIQTVSSILIENDFFEIALELLYNKAIEKANVQARMDYFLATASLPKEFIKEKEVIHIGDYVKYSLNNEIKFILIDENKPLGKALLGHSVGENIVTKRPLVESTDTICILRVMDKYLYLHDEILEDARSDPYSGLGMQSVEFEDLSAEGMTKKLTTLFGASGTVLKETQDNNFKDYYNYEISYSELIVRNFASDYIGGYFHLIREKNGITQFPFFLYPKISLVEKELVIDFSSLLILYQIFLKHGVDYKHKFIISKNIVDVIKRDLKVEIKAPDERLSLNITHNYIIPDKLTADNKKNNIIYLEKLIEWIDNNCVITIALNKLNVLRQFESSKSEEVFQYYFIDIVSLLIDSEKRLLITDDSIYFKFYPIKSARIISSEILLRRIMPKNEEIFTEFINNKYIGFTISSDMLYSEFSKKIKGQPNLYHHCLYSSSLRFIPNQNTIFNVIGFLKLTAINSLLSNEQFKQEATNVLVNLLKGQRESSPYLLTRQVINKEFKLLGITLDIIYESYINALLILGMKV